MTKLVYFAWLRERFGTNSEEIALPHEVATVSDLFDWLAERGDNFAEVLEHRDIIQVAVDQNHVQDRSFNISEAREIALFPPMTGG